MIRTYLVYELNQQGHELILSSLTAAGYSREPGDESGGFFIDEEGRVVLAVSSRPGIHVREVGVPR